VTSAVPAGPNEVWSMDFMSDALWSGRRFRTFNVLDDFAREALRIEIDTSLPAARVVRALDQLAEIPCRPFTDAGEFQVGNLPPAATIFWLLASVYRSA
jgi:transposase InsO family protein